MSVVINQPQGLGDIIFCMAIAEQLKSLGHDRVIWPVNSVYKNIAKHFPQVDIIDINLCRIDYNRKDFYETPEGYTVIPLRWSESLMKVRTTECMRSKYLMAGLDMELWRTCTVKRDYLNELALMKRLGIVEGDVFALVNTHFKTSNKGLVRINNPKMRVIDMKTIEGFTMIDWSSIIELATEIHTVGTSINYLIELLQPKARSIHVYVRHPDERDFKNYDYIFSEKLPYVFHK